MSEISDNENTNAVALFDEQSAENDFPVLKAFQKYIDAEQAKARKRMLMLAAFFVTVLTLVVIVFSMALISVVQSSRKETQALSNRLLDIALRDKEQTIRHGEPITANSTTSNAETSADAILMRTLIKKLDNVYSAPQQSAAAPKQETAKNPSTAAADDETNKELERLKKELVKTKKEQLAVEKARAKAEKERLHQEEVERHRRKLYPEYYNKQDLAAQKAELDRRAAELDAQDRAAKKAELDKRAAELDAQDRAEAAKHDTPATEAAKRAAAIMAAAEVEDPDAAPTAKPKPQKKAEENRVLDVKSDSGSNMSFIIPN